MKSLTINKNSWHYRLLKFMQANIPTDLCKYVRLLIWNIVILSLFATFVGAVVGLYLFSWVMSGIWLFKSIMIGSIYPIDSWIVPVIMTFVFALLCGFLELIGKYRERRRAKAYKRSFDEDSNVQPNHVWQAIRNKMCFKLHFE